MNRIGIIAEYNPFHNGHLYMINKIKEKFNDPFIIVLMSGSFVQRGEPAILDKWTRAKSAVIGGANLVIELPFSFSCQNAEVFAKGAVGILKAFDLTHLVFGAEDPIKDVFINIGRSVDRKTDKFHTLLHSYLDKGESYIVSRNKAYLESKILNEKEIDVLSKSNNILGVEYTKALMEHSLEDIIYPIKRKGVDHKSLKTSGNISSGTYIRENIKNDISKYVPSWVKENLTSNEPDYSMLLALIKYNLLFTDSVLNTLEYEQGMKERIIKYLNTNDFNELITRSTSKRITSARIRRSLINSLINTDKSTTVDLIGTKYIKVLASDHKGFRILSDLKDPHISKHNEIYKLDDNIQQLARIENKATDLYSILSGQNIDQDKNVNFYIKH